MKSWSKCIIWTICMFKYAFGQTGCAGLSLTLRENWGARDPIVRVNTNDNLQYLFVHHSVGPEDPATLDAVATVRGVQNYHMDGRGYWDVAYHFLIGADGSVFEGRGWNVEGGATGGFNDVGYATCFLGEFEDHIPTQAAIDSFYRLAECAVELGKVRSDYELKGHRDTKNTTTCPGETLYQEIQTWPNYSPGYIGSK